MTERARCKPSIAWPAPGQHDLQQWWLQLHSRHVHPNDPLHIRTCSARGSSRPVSARAADPPDKKLTSLLTLSTTRRSSSLRGGATCRKSLHRGGEGRGGVVCVAV